MAKQDDKPLPLEYARPSSDKSERGAWIGLIITLAFCLAAALIWMMK